MGPDRKKFETTCHLTFLKKKSLDPLPIKVKTNLPILRKVKTKKKIDSPSNAQHYI